MVGGVVQLVLLFQELWRRSEESGETLSHTEVVWAKNYMVVWHVYYTCIERECFRCYSTFCIFCIHIQGH